MQVGRRKFLQLASATFAATAIGQQTKEKANALISDVKSLQRPPGSTLANGSYVNLGGELFDAGIVFNMGFPTWYLRDKRTALSDFAAEQASSIKTKNALKPGRINPNNGVYDESGLELVGAYTNSTNLVLNWHLFSGTPEDRTWLAGQLNSPADAIQALNNYALYMKGKFEQYYGYHPTQIDVINEPFHSQTPLVNGEIQFKDQSEIPYLKTLSGLEWVEASLDAIKNHFPHSKPRINLTKILSNYGQTSLDMRAASLQLLQYLQSNNYQVSLGLQGHMFQGAADVNKSNLAAVQNYLAQAGQYVNDIHVTEFDILSSRWNRSRNRTKKMLEVVFGEPQVKGFGIWGVVNGNLSNTSEDEMHHWGHEDRWTSQIGAKRNKGLPFEIGRSGEIKTTKVYQGIQNALNAAQGGLTSKGQLFV